MLKTETKSLKQKPERVAHSTLVDDTYVVRVFMYHPLIGLYEMPGSKFFAKYGADVTEQVSRIYATNPVTYLTYEYDSFSEYNQPIYRNYIVKIASPMWVTSNLVFSNKTIITLDEDDNYDPYEILHVPLVVLERCQNN